MAVYGNNCTVRNCRIRHASGVGLAITGDDCRIEDCEIICTGQTEPEGRDAGWINVSCLGADRLVIERVRVQGGSSGFYLDRCDDARLSMVDGSEFHGPFPRGQFVQFNTCVNPLIEDFSVTNGLATSWTEDNVNFFFSADGICRRGIVNGNNSPSGIGILFESSTGLIQDCDAMFQSNGNFGFIGQPVVPGSQVMEGVRFRDYHNNEESGRGPPLSGWPVDTEGNKISIHSDVQDVIVRVLEIWHPPELWYFSNPSWLYHSSNASEITPPPGQWPQVDFTPRPIIDLTFPWS